MKKQILIIGLALILFSSFVSADLTTDLVSYWKFDGNADDSVGSNDGTVNGATYTASGKINGSYSFDGVDDIITTSYIVPASSHSFSFWIKTTSSGVFRNILQSGGVVGGNDNGLQVFLSNTNTITYVYGNGVTSGHFFSVSGSTTVNDGNWHHISGYYDGSTAYLYVDGVLDNSASSAGSGVAGTGLSIGASTSVSNPRYFNGKIDEPAIWDGALTSTEITELYNSGSGKQYPFLFELTVSNLYNGSAISTFNATITNATTSSTISTTNGSIFWPSGQIVNITVEAENYFDRTYTNFNTNTSLDAELWQAVLVVNAREKFTNTTITDFNVTSTDGIYSQFNTSNASGNVTLLVNADTYNITGKAAMYDFNATDESISLSVGETKAVLLEFVSKELNVSAKEYFSNETISDFTVQLKNEDLGILYNITTTDGLAQLYGVEGIYNVTIFTDTYADESVLVNMSNTSTNYIFYLFTTNSIFMEFFDEVSKDPLDSTTVSVELISSVYSENYTTSNGSLYVDILSPSVYTIRTVAPGYDARFYQYTLTDNSNTYIPIYLVNSTDPNYKQIAVTVIDQQKKNVPGTTIKLLRFDIDSNAYTVREIVTTDFEGIGYLDVIQFGEFYKIIIEYEGEVKYTTEKFQINKDSYTFQIILGQSVGDAFFRAYDVNADVSFTDSTDTFRFEYTDTSNRVTSACLEVYKTNLINSSELIGINCANGTTGIIYEAIEPVNGSSYSGLGFVYFGDTEQHMDTETVQFKDTPSFDGVGIFAVILFTLVFFGMLIFTGEVLFVSMLPVPLVLGALTGVVNIQFGYAIGFEIVGIVVALFLKARKT